MIWYNIANRAALSGQVNAGSARRLGRVLEAAVTNAWPRFWGVDLGGISSRPLRWLFVAVLAWVAVLFVWALVRGARRWLRGEETLGYQLVFGNFLLHLGVITVSSYGSRFETTTPLSYVGPLFAVAFCIPALVLQSRLAARAKAAALPPFALLVGNNLAATASYPRAFFAALREEGLARVTRYPNEKNPFLRLVVSGVSTPGTSGGPSKACSGQAKVNGPCGNVAPECDGIASGRLNPTDDLDREALRDNSPSNTPWRVVRNSFSANGLKANRLLAACEGKLDPALGC